MNELRTAQWPSHPSRVLYVAYSVFILSVSERAASDMTTTLQVTPLAKVSHWTQPWASLIHLPSSQIILSKIHRLAITPPLSWPPKWTNIFWKRSFILSSKIWITPPAPRNIKFVSPFVQEQTAVSYTEKRTWTISFILHEFNAHVTYKLQVSGSNVHRKNEAVNTSV